MGDAAAFFANKKKKKKGFKGFNANKVDAASVSQTVHVDAPALSTNAESSTSAVMNSLASTSLNDGGNVGAAGANGNGSLDPKATAASEQWDDEAMAASYNTSKRQNGVAAANATTELLDMKALDAKRREQDDIAERLRIQETKAALAAAKEGMEREAERLKAEREKEHEKQQQQQQQRHGIGSADGGRWLPPHLRARGGPSGLGPRFGAAAQVTKKLDTQNQELFPDLASADKILETQQKNQVAYKVTKKTAVGGGATWGSRPALKLKPKSAAAAPKPASEATSKPSKQTSEPAVESKPSAPKETPAAEKPAPAAEEKTTPAAASTTTTTKTSATATSTVVKKKTKKKKKDLTTFKPGSS